MFHEISAIDNVVRFDRIVNTRDLRIGAVEDAGGERLALKLPTDEVVVMEEQGERQLFAQWGVPHAHAARLPVAIRGQELRHFADESPRDVMLRAVEDPASEYGRIRGVVSSKYEKFDNSDVITALSGDLAGWEITSRSIGRDDMRLQAVMPRMHDVSARQVGDFVKAGLTVTNDELGRGCASVSFSIFRLCCLNGMTSSANVAAKIRHIWVSRENFVAKIRQAVADAGVAGEAMARLLRRAHDHRVTKLDPDGDRLSRSILNVIRAAGVFSKGLVDEVNAALGPVEPQSLFGVAQVLSNAAVLATMSNADRIARERATGRILQLAA